MIWCPESWERHTYAHRDHHHAFYVVDHDRHKLARPSVMLMHEFPGISADLVQLADTLARDFRVVVPSLFGRDGTPTAGNSLKQICVRREVYVLARHGVSKSVAWLRDFTHEHLALGRNEPYGVIGMCLSGNFALALAVDPCVKAAVAAQPSLPLWPSGLGLSPGDQDALQKRNDLCAQGYRFRRDYLSPAAKLQSAEELLGSANMRIFSLDAPNGRGHSTLTGKHRDENAIQGVRSFLTERLVLPDENQEPE